jgi:carbon monoxide dehydrogenase subunit G
MEIEYDLSRSLRAPVSDCWALITDPQRTPEWLTIVSDARAEGPPGEGQVISARGGLLGITTRTRQTVHLWEPERRYGWRGDDPFPLVVECTLEPAGDGTEFRVQAAATPGRFFPVGKSVVRRAVRSQLHRSADRFQRLVEGG